MSMVFGFEKLRVWQRARSFVVDVYGVVADFPDYEKFGLSNQLRRASISIASNIAEGANRSGLKDKQRFYELAYGSLMEVVNQLIIAYDLGYLKQDSYEKLRDDAYAIASLISGLRRSTSPNP